MLNYSIMNLDEDHVDFYCEDVRRQVEEGVATMPLFKMTLTPEGNPVTIDKAGMLTKSYLRYKERLDAAGLPSGVLMRISYALKPSFGLGISCIIKTSGSVSSISFSMLFQYSS